VKLLKVILVGVVLALVVAELGARYLIQNDVASAAAAGAPSAQHVRASVSFPLLPGLVAGQSIARVVVSAGSVDLGSITAQRVVATATGVHLKVGSVVGQRMTVTRIDHLDIAATISADEASNILPPGLTFVFGQDTVTLQSPVTSITGRFTVASPGHLAFTVPGGSILGLAVPPLTFSAGILPSCVKGVMLAPGTLTLTCSEDNPPTTFLPAPKG
jgi:hypothetical protein